MKYPNGYEFKYTEIKNKKAREVEAMVWEKKDDIYIIVKFWEEKMAYDVLTINEMEKIHKENQLLID